MIPNGRWQMRTLASLIILCASLSPLTAQWPSRPTAGVPRTPDGKPNLSAPAPRSADGKPDLSGVWRIHKSCLLNAVPDLKQEDIQPWAAALYKRSADNFRNDTDGINCLPPGPKTSTSGGGAPVPRRSPSVLRYKSSLGLFGNSVRKRETAFEVGTFIGKLAVEWRLFCWNPAKKKVLFLRIGPPV